MVIGHTLCTGNGIILSVDKAVSDMLMRPMHDIVDRHFTDITHPADRPRNLRLLDLLNPHDPPVTIRKRYLRGDGSTIAVKLQVSRLSSAYGGHLVTSLDHEDLAIDSPLGLWKAARWLVAADGIRRDELGDELSGDPAGALLLNIYLAEAEGGSVTGDVLAEATGLPISSTERWLSILMARGLVERVARHAAACQLTIGGARMVERLLRRIASQGDEKMAGEFTTHRLG